MSKKQHPIIIGIAGGSGSGKTTIAHELYDQFKNDRIRIITEDSYYLNFPLTKVGLYLENSIV
ncbi:hypothetical protein ME791_20160 [Lactobacillus delbrueckii]|uniref:Phosphoribulokinase/uridine kinase domain-containing protein n=1 Tax=Lactobacillus delbrueckii TaxID=1584 RepID=A0ABD0AIN9_9LACO|nr:hypothetical protein ME791_20160 [Lactobacillus delbrueckii]